MMSTMCFEESSFNYAPPPLGLSLRSFPLPVLLLLLLCFSASFLSPSDCEAILAYEGSQTPDSKCPPPKYRAQDHRPQITLPLSCKVAFTYDLQKKAGKARDIVRPTHTLPIINIEHP